MLGCGDGGTDINACYGDGANNPQYSFVNLYKIIEYSGPEIYHTDGNDECVELFPIDESNCDGTVEIEVTWG